MVLKFTRRFLVFLALFLLLPCVTYALDTHAVSAVVMEEDTNCVVYEKNAHRKLPMASTTKIMTALCAIESGNLDKIVRVDDRAIGIEGSSIYLARGERLSLKDLVYGLMLNSGNDAAVAIACAVSGSVEEFCNLMNETARRIGAKNTHFDNPNGLDGKTHYTTAYDLALITSHALKNKEFSKIVSTYKTTIPNGDKGFDRVLKNHNKLLKIYPYATGVKTGFTKKSGRCLVSSATKDGKSFVAVTLNDGNDWQDHISMMEYAFSSTSSRTVIKKGEHTKKIYVSGGNAEYINALAGEGVCLTLLSQSEEGISVSYNFPPFLNAPVKYGQSVGKINVYYKDKLIKSIDAVSDSSVEKKGIGLVVDNFLVLLDFWFDLLK